MTVTSPAFHKLVQALKSHKKTLTVVEQCCGGLISSSVLAQPGASAVYYGGSVSYNTKHSKPLLLNDEKLFQSITQNRHQEPTQSEAEQYIQSKLHWTAETAVAFCRTLGTDFAIAEGGASGPTFRPKDMDKGFAVISVAGKDSKGRVSLLEQQVIHSDSNNREQNMRLFADRAAHIATSVINAIENPAITKHAQCRGIDRAVHLRTNATALMDMEERAMFIVLQGTSVLVQNSFELALIDYQMAQQIIPDPQNRGSIFLGLLAADRTPVFAIDFNTDAPDASGLPAGSSFADTRTTAPLLSSLHNELVLHATALAQWRRRNKFCSLCGGPLAYIDGGTACQCKQCHAKSWPRQDPSIIVLVSSRDGERVLLGKSPRHPERMYTVLAGFVEAGETFEASVAREAFEETGVLIDEESIQYYGSQPWPFPQSCMIGFIATADDSLPLNVDTKELVDAKWFHRSDVKKAAQVPGATMKREVAEAAIHSDPSLPLLIPPKGVIARRLLDRWLEVGRDETQDKM